MPKTVAANEAKQRLGSLLGYVSEQGDEVIVERHGRPTAVLISVAAYDDFKTLREQKRRAEALQRLRRLEEGISAGNQDLTEEEAIEVAVRLSHELIDDMAARGELVFERDRR